MENETQAMFIAYGRKKFQDGASITGFYAYPHEDVVGIAEDLLYPSGASLGVLIELSPTVLLGDIPSIIYPEKPNRQTYEMFGEMMIWLDRIRSDMINGEKPDSYALYLRGEQP